MCLRFSLGYLWPVKLSYLRTTPLVNYFLANENPILVYVVLFLFILSLLDRKSNIYVSMVLDILFPAKGAACVKAWR